MSRQPPGFAKLHEMAQSLRESARQTCHPEYILMMMRAAEDLDTFAEQLEHASQRRTVTFTGATQHP